MNLRGTHHHGGEIRDGGEIRRRRLIGFLRANVPLIAAVAEGERVELPGGFDILLAHFRQVASITLKDPFGLAWKAGQI